MKKPNLSDRTIYQFFPFTSRISIIQRGPGRCSIFARGAIGGPEREAGSFTGTFAFALGLKVKSGGVVELTDYDYLAIDPFRLREKLTQLHAKLYGGHADGWLITIE